MELKIIREYFPHGTNGNLFVDGQPYHHTIELPNKGNQHQVSCVPEGRYNLVKHHSDHLGQVLMLVNVPDRDMIYIHAANNAEKELLGCIAPVTTITGEGQGSSSRAVFEPLRDKVYAALDKGEHCYIIIESVKPAMASDNAPVQQSHL